MPNSLARFVPQRLRRDAIPIPVVRLSGPIMASGGGFRQTLSMATAAPVLKKAFDSKKAPAVAVVVNSPGGSPVQSRLIHQRIRDLAEEKKKRVIVYVEDVAASGGYMIACAGDEIVADPSSIVGSIGVVSGSFGFVDAIKKLGIERRVHTAGNNKAVLDPFRPEKPEDVEHLKDLQREVHETFIDLVKESRGGRLKPEEEMFSGLFWSGKRGLDLGLVDRLGDLHSDLRGRFGDKVRPVLVQAGRSLFGRKQTGVSALLPGDAGLAAVGAGAVDEIARLVEERALWGRYGL